MTPLRLAGVVVLATLFFLSLRAPAQASLSVGDVPLPLRSTTVTATISGDAARVVVRQRFAWPPDARGDLMCEFGVPDAASLVGFTLEIGDRRFVGEVVDVEETSPEIPDLEGTCLTSIGIGTSLYLMQVADLEPIESIEVEIAFVETLHDDGGGSRFVFPHLPRGRFEPPPSEAVSTNPALGGPAADPRVHGLAGAPLSLVVRLDSGVPLREVTSPTHAIEVASEGAHGARVTLAGVHGAPALPFVLTWKREAAELQTPVLANRTEGNGAFSLTLFPPTAPPSQGLAREVFFVIDRSASMQGAPLAKARAFVTRSLRLLDPDDRFQISSFADEVSFLLAEPLAPTPDAIGRARTHLEAMGAAGETRMAEAMRTILEVPSDRTRPRVIYLLTDGFVAWQVDVLAVLRESPQPVSVFPVGMGPASSADLIDRLARAGAGRASFIRFTDADDLSDDQVRSILDPAKTPVLSGITIDWGGLPVSDTIPASIPDLFLGRPIIIRGRYKWAASGTVRIRGRQGNTPVEITIPVRLPGHEPAHPALPTQWARARIADLLLLTPDRWNPKIARIALRQNMTSRATRLMAFEERTVPDGSGSAPVIRDAIPWAWGLGPNREYRVAYQASSSSDEEDIRGTLEWDRLVPRGLRKGLNAIDRCLIWLANQQDASGTFRHAPTGAADIEATSLVLLAGLGRNPYEFKGMLPRGLAGLRALIEEGPTSLATKARSRALTALALSEGFQLDHPELEQAALQALEALLACQAPDGSWRDGDTSADMVTLAWAALALHSAGLASLVDASEAAQRALAFVQTHVDPTTGRCILDPHGSPFRNAAAALLVHSLREGTADSEPVQELARLVVAQGPGGDDATATFSRPSRCFGSKVRTGPCGTTVSARPAPASPVLAGSPALRRSEPPPPRPGAAPSARSTPRR